MKIEAFISDWEGCIVEPGGGRVPWPIQKIVALRDAIKQLEVPFVLCTGRQFPYVAAAIQALDACNDIPSIAENGVGLYFPKTKKVLLHPAITSEVQEALSEVRQEAFRLIESIGGNREYGKEFCISLNPPSGYSIEEFYQYVQEQLNEFRSIIEISHSQSAVDITPKGINKGAGVKYLAEVTGIDLTNVVGIGDSQGDLAMLRLVGHPACPANADENVKEIVEYVSPHETTEGVIDIIQYFAKIGK